MCKLGRDPLYRIDLEVVFLGEVHEQQLRLCPAEGTALVELQMPGARSSICLVPSR